MTEFKISASVSCMDQCYLKNNMEAVEKSKVSFYHYDVVDGRFNQCFILGETTLQFMRKEAKLPIEVHLAVFEPEKYMESYIRTGADYIAVHYEAMEHPVEIFKKIRELGAEPILAYRADTAPGEDFIELAKEVKWILKLTVNPGFAGQKMQEQAVEHIGVMRRRLEEAGLNISIQADGNINLDTIPIVAKAGADILTGGTSGLFKAGRTVKENCNQMLKAAFDTLR